MSFTKKISIVFVATSAFFSMRTVIGMQSLEIGDASGLRTSPMLQFKKDHPDLYVTITYTMRALGMLCAVGICTYGLYTALVIIPVLKSKSNLQKSYAVEEKLIERLKKDITLEYNKVLSLDCNKVNKKTLKIICKLRAFYPFLAGRLESLHRHFNSLLTNYQAP